MMVQYLRNRTSRVTGNQCTICGSDCSRLVFIKNSYHIVKCLGCGLVFVPPRYATKYTPRDLYDENYFKGEVYKNYANERHYRLKLFEDKFCLIKRKRGYEVFGVEISQYATDHVAELIRPNIFAGELKNARFPSEFFDIITMWDTLEHLQNPMETLQEANRILERSGVIIIETLNITCLNAKILGPRWPLYRPPYHLFYFSLDTLTKLLSKSGFNVFKVEPIQTYSPIHSHKAIRYFDKPSIIRKLFKLFLADVLLVMARK